MKKIIVSPDFFKDLKYEVNVEVSQEEICTDPEHEIPRDEFNSLSFHEYEAERERIWNSWTPNDETTNQSTKDV